MLFVVMLPGFQTYVDAPFTVSVVALPSHTAVCPVTFSDGEALTVISVVAVCVQPFVA